MLQLLFTMFGLFLPVCTEYLETSSRSNAELSIRQHRKPQSQRHPHESEKDCTIAKRVCQEDLYCSSVYRSFQRACRAEAAKCRMGSQECLSAWKELRKTVLGECKCSEPLQRRCLRIWKGIFSNPCLQYSQGNQGSVASENGDEDDDDGDDHDKNQDTDTGWCYSGNQNPFTHACVCGKKKKRILKTLQFTTGNRIVLRGLFRCKWIIWKQNKSLSENTILLQWVSLLTPDPNQPLLALHYG